MQWPCNDLDQNGLIMEDAVCYRMGFSFKTSFTTFTLPIALTIIWGEFNGEYMRRDGGNKAIHVDNQTWLCQKNKTKQNTKQKSQGFLHTWFQFPLSHWTLKMGLCISSAVTTSHCISSAVITSPCNSSAVTTSHSISSAVKTSHCISSAVTTTIENPNNVLDRESLGQNQPWNEMTKVTETQRIHGPKGSSVFPKSLWQECFKGSWKKL